MDAIYQDNGSGQLTAKELKDIINTIPDDAMIESVQIGNSQRDSWTWSIRAKQSQVPPARPNLGHKPGYRGTGERDNHGL